MIEVVAALLVLFVVAMFVIPMWAKGRYGQGKLLQPVIENGAWCPHCHQRNSVKETKVGCLYGLLVLLSFGLGLLIWPLLPREWHCRSCENRWRA